VHSVRINSESKKVFTAYENKCQVYVNNYSKTLYYENKYQWKFQSLIKMKPNLQNMVI